MPDSKEEADFRSRYLIACLSPVPSIWEPDVTVEIATIWWLDSFCGGPTLEKTQWGQLDS